MIDIHCHLIYGVDDGPSSIKDSIRMVLEAEKQGVTDIIATPHFNNQLYNLEMLDNNFRELESRVVDCGVNLHLGYEVFINELGCDPKCEMAELTLKESGYLLFELPFDNIPVFTKDTILKMHTENIIPVIAHPERNKNFVKNFDTFIDFIENGCLIQVDAPSIAGVYGSDVRNFAKKLIKLNLAHFVASDSHCPGDYDEKYSVSYSKVKKWAGEEYARKLFDLNPRVILKNSKG